MAKPVRDLFSRGLAAGALIPPKTERLLGGGDGNLGKYGIPYSSW